jgi:sortase A
MDKVAPQRGKFSLVLRVLSAGALVLGMGLVVWALMNIAAQSVPSAEAHSDAPYPTTTLAASQPKSTVAKAAPAPKEGAKIGSLSIPALKQSWPIIEGTGTSDLKKGVGHFMQSVLPGAKDNCVLSGHRDTVFAKLGKVKIGDQLIVQSAAGTFTYEVKRIRIVHQDDRTVIVHTDHAVLTLTTCYPFHFIGSAPDRYIVSADLVASK